MLSAARASIAKKREFHLVKILQKPTFHFIEQQAVGQGLPCPMPHPCTLGHPCLSFLLFLAKEGRIAPCHAIRGLAPGPNTVHPELNGRMQILLFLHRYRGPIAIV